MEKKSADLVVLDLTGKTSFCDAFIVCSANNPRHVRAIANHIVGLARREHAQRPLGVEGVENGRWALIDFGDVLVHVFEASVRKYYNLEGLWLDARRVSPEELGVVVRPPLPDSDDSEPDELSGYLSAAPDDEPATGEEAEEGEEPEDFYGQAPTP